MNIIHGLFVFLLRITESNVLLWSLTAQKICFNDPFGRTSMNLTHLMSSTDLISSVSQLFSSSSASSSSHTAAAAAGSGRGEQVCANVIQKHIYYQPCKNPAQISVGSKGLLCILLYFLSISSSQMYSLKTFVLIK